MKINNHNNLRKLKNILRWFNIPGIFFGLLTFVGFAIENNALNFEGQPLSKYFFEINIVINITFCLTVLLIILWVVFVISSLFIKPDIIFLQDQIIGEIQLRIINGGNSGEIAHTFRTYSHSEEREKTG